MDKCEPVMRGSADSSKTNLELLKEIDELIENSTAEELDANEIMKRLDLLQERAPVEPMYSQQEAWDRLMEKVTDGAVPDEPIKQVNPRRRKLVRIAVGIAAAIALLVGATLTASAFGFNLWGWLTRWTDNDFRFVPAETASTSEPVGDEYADIPSALAGLGITEPLYPTWIPEGFELVNTSLDITEPIRMVATYSNGDQYLFIRVSKDNGASTRRFFEKDQTPLIEYYHGAAVHYILYNNDYCTSVWHTNDYEVYVTGTISKESMIKIIDSVYEVKK